MKAGFEKILPKGDHSFSAFHFRNVPIGCSFHFHPEVELTWIESGSGSRLIGDHLGQFEDGDLVLIGSGVAHYYIENQCCDDRMSASENSYYCVQFDESFAGSEFFDLPEFKPVFRMLERAKRGLYFGNVDASSQLGRTIIRTVESSGPLRVLSLLETLVILSEKGGEVLCSPSLQLKLSEIHQARVEKACATIFNHFDEDLRLPDLAQQCSLSSSAFSRVFHRATGKTFKVFLTETRIAHARKLLMETDGSVIDISLACGFKNLSNFNRSFLEMNKMTPTDYRRNVRAQSL